MNTELSEKVADILVDPATSEKKVADILIDNLKEALKAVDLSIGLAFVCVVFMLMHGLQSDFVRATGGQGPNTVQSPGEINGRADDRRVPEKVETTIPFFGFKADLFGAAIAAIILYWVFCLRAALRCWRAKLIARRLEKIDPEVAAAVLLLPSLATANKLARVLLCVALGGLGTVAFVAMYTPMHRALDMLGPAAIAMLIPVCILGAMIWLVPRSRLIN